MNLDFELEKMLGNSEIQVPGLGVIIYKDGAEIYSNFLGRRVIGENEKPVTRQTRFRAASISKMFTVFTIMQLVERGKINLDADISNYLNFKLRNPNFPAEKITVRMLASHTSTLRDGTIYSIPPEIGVEEFFKPDGKFYEGGAHFATEDKNFFSYSNLNYGILGTIIENVTGKRFDIYQRENILAQLETAADYVPANLKRAEFENLGTVYQKKNPQGVWNEFGDWYGKADDFKNIQPAEDTIFLQNPYAENFQQSYSLTNYKIGTNATIFSPQGGLRISFSEMANALEMLMNGGNFHGKKILEKKSIAEMFKPQWIYNGANGNNYGGEILNYGLGVYHIDGKTSARVCKNHEINLIGHTGVAFGMLSGIFFIPQTKSGFIYMMNGTAIDEDNDARSCGKFSGNYIWEENLMNAVCNFLNR
jgi:CubicO group peptidase (beta-lactamase class C family)